MGINLVQTSEIEKFFLQQAEGDLQLASWLNIGLMRSICRRAQNAVELLDLPPDAPDWLQRKWPEGGPFHRFQPDAELADKVRHIADWLSAARTERAPFLQKRDKDGVPLKVRQLNLESAFNAATKYFGRAHSRAGAPLSAKIRGAEEPGVITALELAQGRRFVEITSPAALKAEGLRMKHCVGGHGYGFSLLAGQMSFYSLRDADGRPKATISLHSNGWLDQCKGERDGRADEQHLPEIAAFLEEKKAKINKFHNDLPGYIQLEDGGIMPVHKLPECYDVKTTLQMADIYTTTCLPARITVKGDVVIARCPSLEAIGDDMTVMGQLYIKDCMALRALPRGLKVGGQMTIESSGLRRFPEGLDVRGDIVLRGCKSLELLNISGWAARSIYVTDCEQMALPPEIHVWQWLLFDAMRYQSRVPGNAKINGSFSVRNCREVTEIGDNLHVTGDLCLEDCPKLKTLPANLRVDGHVTITNCGIESLPVDMQVGGGVTITHCKRLRHMDGPRLVSSWLAITDCPLLESLPDDMTAGKELLLVRNARLGRILPVSLRTCPKIRTDLFLSEEHANM